MSKLRLTQRFYIDGHTFDADEVVEVPEGRAKQLIEAGVGVQHFPPPTPPPNPDPPPSKPRANKRAD